MWHSSSPTDSCQLQSRLLVLIELCRSLLICHKQMVLDPFSFPNGKVLILHENVLYGSSVTAFEVITL